MQSLPVIMLTISQREEDVIRSWAYCAGLFIHKSLSLDQFRERLRQFEHYWKGVSRILVARK